MAIKIYQSQVSPTSEVSERESTRGMRISLDDATRPARALKGMLRAGEDFYVEYEKTKSENEVLEKSKEVEFGVKDDNGNTLVEGLGETKTKVSEYADMDKAMSEYKTNWQNTKDRIIPTLKGRFSKKLFNSYMDKTYLSDKSAIQTSNVRGMLYKNRTLKLQSLEPLYKILSTAEIGSNEYKQAENKLTEFFKDPSNQKLFGGKIAELEFTSKATVDVLRFKRDISIDPLKTYIDIKNPQNYANLPTEKRNELELSAKRYAQSFAAKEFEKNYQKALKGEMGTYKNSELLSAFEGEKNYNEIFEQSKVIDIVQENSNIIKDAKYGEASKLISQIKVSGDNIKLKEKAQDAIRSAISAKNKAIQNDAAGYYITENEDVEVLTKEVNDAFEKYVETNDEADLENYKVKFNERADFLDQIYEEKEIPKRFRTYVTQAEAKSIVAQYKATPNPANQSALIESLKLQYGNKSSDVFMQLQKEGLPFGAMMTASVNNPQLKDDINDGSINIKAYETNYKTATGSTGEDLKLLKNKVAKQLDDYTDVITNQPGGEVNASGFINGLRESIYNAAMAKYNRGVDIDDAIKEASKEFLQDYRISDSETYWVPADVNGQAVSQQHIMAKADVVMKKIKDTDYLKEINLKGVDEDNQELIINDIKKNSNFYLNEKGDGIVLHVERNNGSSIPVVDVNGQRIEILFLDNSTTLPITNTPFGYEEMYEPVQDETYMEVN